MTIQKAKGWRLLLLRDLLTGFPMPHNPSDLQIVLILTAGSDPSDHSQPNEIGQQRIHRGVRILARNPLSVGVICGYFPDNTGVTLSEKSKRYIERNFSLFTNRFPIVGGTGNNTVSDIVSLWPELQELRKQKGVWIGLPTDRQHTNRTAPTLYAMGFRVVWLGQGILCDRPYSSELMLLLVAFIDPFFNGWLSRKLGVVEKTAAVAEEYRQSTVQG